MSLIKCSHPIRVVNQYTGKVLYVDCRHCPSCLNKRSLQLQQRVKDEFNRYPNGSALFVTLHYDNDHLPMVRPYFVTYGYKDGVINRFDTQLCENSEWILSEIHTGALVKWIHDDFFKVPNSLKSEENFIFNNSSVREYLHPVNMSNLNFGFGVLSKYDIQCFIKRLRIKLQRYCKLNSFNYEEFKFRYFIAGEYGPTTQRPHYHAVFWFKGNRQSIVASNLLSSAWPLGSFDVRKANAGTSRYLASYVNSRFGLSEIFSFKSLRPFSLSSSAPLLGFNQSHFDELRKSFVTGIVYQTRTFLDASKIPCQRDFLLSSVITRHWLPRCRRYCEMSYLEKYQLYSYVPELVRQGYSERYACDKMKVDVVLPPRLFCLPADTRDVQPVKYRSFSYQDILASKMANFWCSLLDIDVHHFLWMLDRFYKNIEMFLLKSQYVEQESVVDKYSIDTFANMLSFDIDFSKNFVNNLNCLEFSRARVFACALNSYNLDLSDFYDNEGNLFNIALRDKCIYYNTPSFIAYSKLSLKIFNDSYKKKKHNDYLRNNYYLRRGLNVRKNIFINFN